MLNVANIRLIFLLWFVSGAGGVTGRNVKTICSVFGASSAYLEQTRELITWQTVMRCTYIYILVFIPICH